MSAVSACIYAVCERCLVHSVEYSPVCHVSKFHQLIISALSSTAAATGSFSTTAFRAAARSAGARKRVDNSNFPWHAVRNSSSRGDWISDRNSTIASPVYVNIMDMSGRHVGCEQLEERAYLELQFYIGVQDIEEGSLDLFSGRPECPRDLRGR